MGTVTSDFRADAEKIAQQFPNNQALQRYKSWLTLSHSVAAERMSRELKLNDSKLRITPIDGAALSAWKDTWKPHLNERTVCNDWDVERPKYDKNFKRFDAAIWYGDELCGLVIGEPSKGGDSLKIRYVEGKPAQKDGSRHPLKGYICKIAIEAVTFYAAAIKATNVIVISTAGDVVACYEREGLKAKDGCCEASVAELMAARAEIAPQPAAPARPMASAAAVIAHKVAEQRPHA